jgi:uncharacterized metal-binding protein YceD (DUF177 family)
MDDLFKIYVEQLREGRERLIEETLDPEFLDVNEEDLAFVEPVEVTGSAYLAEQELVIHWDAHTEALIPCAICNEPVEVPVEVNNFYFSEPLSEIKTGIYSFKDLLRETILVETPLFAECAGSCPKREEYKQFLKDPSDQPSIEEEGYNPFVDLDWKQ